MSDLDNAPVTGKKGRATPKRTEARAARANQRKAAPLDRKARAAERRRAMQDAREALNQTDVSKLPSGERVPELIYTRDLVDAKFYAAQSLIWIMVGVVLIGLIPNRAVSYYVTLLGLASLVVVPILTWIDVRRVANQVAERFPTSTVRVRWYAGRRMFQPRRLRKPVPRVARGAQIN